MFSKKIQAVARSRSSLERSSTSAHAKRGFRPFYAPEALITPVASGGQYFWPQRMFTLCFCRCISHLVGKKQHVDTLNYKHTVHSEHLIFCFFFFTLRSLSSFAQVFTPLTFVQSISCMIKFQRCHWWDNEESTREHFILPLNRCGCSGRAEWRGTV